MDVGSMSAMYQDIYKTAAGAGASKLQNQLGADYSKATDKELMDVCKQFEAYFLEQVFKEMAKSVSFAETASSSNSTLMDYYKERMIQTLAEQSTEQQGLGIAQTLYEQMRRNYGLDGKSVTAEELRNRQAAVEAGAALAAGTSKA